VIGFGHVARSTNEDDAEVEAAMELEQELEAAHV
jgi:hypothetical protein